MESQENIVDFEVFDILIAENELSEIFDCNKNLISANGLVTDTNNILSERHAKEVLRAYNFAKESTQIAPTLIECSHCETVFSGELFEKHVCTHNADKTLILPTYVQENVEESEFDRYYRKTYSQLSKNRDDIIKLIRGSPLLISKKVKDDFAKNGQARQSNHDCLICNRKFVHESGLYRHYDKHIGEMLPLNSSSTSRLYPVILCVFCGESFTIEEKAWSHFADRHLEIGAISSKELHQNSNSESETQKTEIKKKKFSDFVKESDCLMHESTYICQQRQPLDLPISNFLRLIYVSKLYQCEQCDSRFSNKKSLLSHTSKHDPSTFFSCEACNLNGLSLKDLLLHWHSECGNVHNVNDSLKDIPIVWVCNVCDDEVRGLEQLILHRALEVFKDYGRRLSEIIEEQRKLPGASNLGGPRRFKHVIIFWLQCEQEILNRRLNNRVDSMVKDGLLEEIRLFYDEYVINRNVDYEEGILQTIGFKEFIPYLEKYDKSHDTLINKFVETPEAFQEEPDGYKSLLQCLEELKLVTQRYSKRQLKWIKNRFLGSEYREVPFVYPLNTSDVSKWKEVVYEPAEATILAYINEEEIKLKPLEKLKRLGEGLNEETTHYCETCERLFIGDFQWQLHLKSNKHKRQIARKVKLEKLKD